MKVSTEELERCEILLTIEVEPAEEDKILKKAAKKIARQVNIPGFRPGKAPYNTVVRRFGLESVQQEALEDSAEKLITDALQEADLRPSAQISFDNISWEPLTLKIKVPGQPKADLGDYRALRLGAETVEVSDEDVNEELKRLQERQASWAPVERPSQLNDLVTISVVEKDGEEVLSEHDSIEYELVLPEAEEDAAESTEDEAEDDEETPSDFQPDLTTPLLGLSAGDEKTFSIEYPADYSDDKYAGKEITFTVNISSVKEKELDPLDDEFAQAVSDFETLAELKADIEEKLREFRQREADQKLGQELLDKIVEGADKVDWPVALEDEMLEDELRRLTAEIERMGLTMDSYLQIEKKDEAEFRAEIRENLLTGLKRSIVLGELAGLEKLSINNSEVLGRAKAIADTFGGGDQIWQYLLSSEAQQNRLANELLTEKVLLRLAAIAKGEAPEVGAEEDESEAVVEEATPTPEASTEADQEAADVASESAVEAEAATPETDEPETSETDEPVTTEA